MGAKRVIVVGAGAGGLVAAGRAAEVGARVLLLEKMDRPGRKILVSGKGRCNLSNIKDIDGFLPMYGSNGVFLRQVFHRFFREELLTVLARYGLETKVERGGRIFPVGDDASRVVGALGRYGREYGVELRTGVRVTGVRREGGRVTGVETSTGFIAGERVIIATGGSSWPQTGSTGDGYTMAAALGHRVVPLRPALVPLVVKEGALARAMQGVSLRNVRVTAFRGEAASFDSVLTPHRDYGRGLRGSPRPPVIESRLGEMVFTHFGLGGPIVLLMSLAVVDALATGPVGVSIDLKPALDRDALRRRIQRDLDGRGKRQFKTILAGLLPAKMVDPVASLCKVEKDRLACFVTAAEKMRLVDTLKSLRFTVVSSLPLSSAIVTAGGVSLDEVDPRTMASRLVEGLYFCGEVLDIDADTGGYNLQAAFSTGWVAGNAAGDYA